MSREEQNKENAESMEKGEKWQTRSQGVPFGEETKLDAGEDEPAFERAGETGSDGLAWAEETSQCPTSLVFYIRLM